MQDDSTITNKEENILVGIPLYNSEETIASVILTCSEYSNEVVCIDDCSTDLSVEIAKKAGATIISHSTNRGVGGVAKTFFNYAKEKNATIVVLIDSDGQHNPYDLPRLIEPLLKNEADLVIGSRFVLGGDSRDTEAVEELYKWRFGNYIPVIKTDFETAEMIKYMCNCFFATKVSYMNEMRKLSDKIGANWEDCIDGFSLDGRIGHTHLAVPGPDGKFGFGGSCFPKDVQAMSHFMNEMGVSSNVLNGSWKTNLEVRPEEDWKELKGRAVVEDDVDLYAMKESFTHADEDEKGMEQVALQRSGSSNVSFNANELSKLIAWRDTKFKK